MSWHFFFLLTSGINNNGSYGSFISPQNLIVWRVALLSLCQVWILKLNCYSSSCSVIVRVSVVLKRAVGDSDWRLDNPSSRHLQSHCGIVPSVDINTIHWWHNITMTLKMMTAQVVETSVTVTNSSFQNYTLLDDHTTRTTCTDTPGFKPFTINCYSLFTSWLVLFFKWKWNLSHRQPWRLCHESLKSQNASCPEVVAGAKAFCI